MYNIHPSAISLLVPLYNSPQRYYHNLNHIHYGISKISEYKNNVYLTSSQEHTILYSWWFHDAIYSIYPYYDSNNETESASLFREWLYDENSMSDNQRLTLHKKFDEIVYNIQYTARHLEDIKEFKYPTTPIILDVDLVGFSKPFQEVYNDSGKIFKEFAPLALDEKIFLTKRIEFLSTLLKKSNIFYTDYFYSNYEKLARDNIEGVIELGIKELQDLSNK